MIRRYYINSRSKISYQNIQISYPNFAQPNKSFVLSIHYNGINSFLFVNATKIYQFKGKNSEIKDYALCLGNVSKDSTTTNMKKQD